MSTIQTSHVEALNPEGEQPEGESRPSVFSALSGHTPWWIVSTLLHVLIIVLAALVSCSFSPPTTDDSIVTVTELTKAPALNTPEKPKSDSSKVLDRDADGNDPNAPADNITIPPNADLKIGDHDETDNPDLEDKHSARGNPDAHIFDRPQGDISNPGGGGTNGLAFDDTIGYGAAGSKGEGGGFGGGFGTGDGTDKGSGTGTFGRPDGAGRMWMAKRRGGSEATENAVDRALRWLAYHQEADGHWDTVKYSSGQKTDTAMTGMALLAFVGAGHSEKVGKYSDTVKRAVAWLKSKQQANGLIYDSTDAGAHRGVGYPHAISTLAMVEAAGMGRAPDTKAAAQRAIDYATEQHQQGEGSDRLGWRYHPKEAGDLSVTGWFVMAMKSAKIAGLHVDPAAFEGAMKFLASVEYKDAGGDAAYGGTSHFGYKPGDEHAGSGYRLTAIGSLVRQYCGRAKEETQGSVDWFVAKGGVPNWGANGEAVDLYYWYYGSMACFQQNGAVWTNWNTAMVKTLVGNQCKEGNDAGSWPVVGAYSEEWGRVGQTALGALNLEVYYRYERLKN